MGFRAHPTRTCPCTRAYSRETRTVQASWQYIVARLRYQDVINEIKSRDPDDLGFLVYHSKKRRYDATPATAKWNDGSALDDPMVRFTWYLDICKRGKTYYHDQASNRELNKNK